ncbi:HvfC/BufC family peptide modification chaperone [Alteromonas lipolytica]|uniref:Putative DNA-binding domain-containing protein n=1 Tax=Alteromonas lipolytica TaxID=1856405 RepID=A0A1E8F8E1_9ALTE|nr:putative DNA-binding domain-containing protein [Alteromonas lipolytica]OFI32180.1 hypothetical protein BFC17_08115 [Alteromonas lipolytica]GGF83241.1 hypothetical protein GCM10011338_39440 [Alteromonas lipolytica]
MISYPSNQPINPVQRYQADLLQAIHSDPGQAGLAVYQYNLYSTAQRSLSLSFPVVTKMLGEDALYILSRRLLREELPVSGDWADWGYGLVSLLRTSELHATHPYLTEMAGFEWAFHSASRQRHLKLEVDSLARLQTQDPDAIYLQLQPSLQLISSQYPLHGLWQLHRDYDESNVPAKAQLEKVMNSEESGCYVIAQGAENTSVTVTNSLEYQWLDGVRQGLSVGALLDAYPALDFAAWLSAALQKGWIVRLN